MESENPKLRVKPGDRVGAVLSADETTVRLLGYGKYIGEEVPPDGLLHNLDFPNPKIELDNGDVVWGYQCWWGPDDVIKKWTEGREVIMVKIPTRSNDGK